MITMDKKDYKAVDDDKLVTILDDNIRRSIGYYDSQISRERRKVIDYYNATLPRPAHDGNSKYVSMDVYDAVESMKAALLLFPISSNLPPSTPKRFS